MLKKIANKIACWLGVCDWTCDAEQGIPPKPEYINEDPVLGFFLYARMYCRHCGKTCELSERRIKEEKERVAREDMSLGCRCNSDVG